MTTAIILINADRLKINKISEHLAEMKEISEVFSVSGNYDIIAIVRVKNNEELAALVTQHLLTIDGIVKTETVLALRAYSRHDLESMFSI
ncbi:MAG: Lrp/AsnC ligand binding domain-containing protein [Nitrospiraceae bacterium]|nr:Lrp/AsnC ligand binding domain-containing protein [Nitrospiraceae bacterium]